MIDDAKTVRKGEEQDWQNLELYLRARLEDTKDPMQVLQFYGGHANLTYLIRFGEAEYVLRRPPYGKLAPGAHDMQREYRVLSRLNAYYPAAPKAFHYCEDTEIIGAPFVLLERRRGVVIRTEVPLCFTAVKDAEVRLTSALIKAEVELHQVDIYSSGLDNLGKIDGFLERQIAGWHKRWQLSKSDTDIAVDQLFTRLSKKIPAIQKPAIVHNDIKFDNCQFQPDNPDKVTSIFDWDMTTIGDPLTDFATTLSYWPDKRLENIDDLPVMLKGDFPDKDFLKEEYALHSGYDLSRIDWYESFAYLKGAIIAQQLYKRYKDGATNDPRMEKFGLTSKLFIDLACDIFR